MERIKERVEEKEGIPPAQQRLIFSGKQMNDDKTANDYKVTGGSVLHLVLALRGGCPKDWASHKRPGDRTSAFSILSALLGSSTHSFAIHSFT